MEQPLPPFVLRDFSAGMITNMNESVRPRNSVALGLNVNFDDEIGSATTRLGTFIVGGQMIDGNTVIGLHQHRADTNALFAAINDTGGATSVVYRADTGSVSITGLTASKKARFVTFLGNTLLLNGTDDARAYDDSSWSTSNATFGLSEFNTASFDANNLCLEFLDRVYVAGATTTPSRLRYSSIPTSNVISWGQTDPDDGAGYVDVESEDGGGAITALGKVPGYILVFKERSIHRWNFTSSFPESLVNIGAPTQEAIVCRAGICAFFSASSRDAVGIYVTNGGRPIPTSHLTTKNIRKWVQAIPQENYTNVAAWGDDVHFFFSIGDVTVDGQAYENVVLRFSIRTGEWCVRSYPTRFSVGTNYLDSDGNNVLIAGTDDGEVIELDKPEVYTDYVTVSGEPGIVNIQYDIRTYQEKFKLNQIKKITNRLAFNTRNGVGAVPYVIADGQETTHLPSLTKDVDDPQLPQTLTGNYFEFGLKGSVQGMTMTLKEIEVPSLSAVSNYDS